MTSKIQIRRPATDAQPFLIRLLQLVTVSIPPLNEPLVPHETFLAHVTPEIMGLSLADKPEYHECLVQTIYEDIAHAPMPRGYVRLMTATDTASHIRRAIDACGTDLGTIRKSLTPEEWILTLDQQLVWNVIGSGLALQGNATAMIRVLDLIDEMNLLTAEEKQTLLDIDYVCDTIPPEYRSQISRMAMLRGRENPPRAFLPADFFAIVSNKVLVESLDPTVVYTLLVEVMKRFGIETGRMHPSTDVRADANGPTAQTAKTTASTSPSGTTGGSSDDSIEIDP
jgi:hypothetical protein